MPATANLPNPLPVEVTNLSGGADIDESNKLSVKDTSLWALLGEVQASPTANSVLDRLKTQAASLSSIVTLLTTQAGYLDGLEALLTPLSSTLVVQSAPLPATVTATIADTASLSGAVDLGANARLSRIIVPASFEGGAIEFQTSYDNSTFTDLYDQYGGKYRVVAGSSTAVSLADAWLWSGVRYLKIRSATTAGVATVQSGAAAVVLVTVPV